MNFLLTPGVMVHGLKGQADCNMNRSEEKAGLKIPESQGLGDL